MKNKYVVSIVFFAILFIFLVYVKKNLAGNSLLEIFGRFNKRRILFRYYGYYKKGFYTDFLQNHIENGFQTLNKYNLDITSSNNLIVYSLYGTNEIYYKYIDTNANYIKNNFPDWTIRVYCGTDVPSYIINKMIDLKFQVIIVYDVECKSGNSAGAFWRFLSLFEDSNVIISDMDDKLDINKEIRKFFSSNKNVFMRQQLFPFPETHMMAGRIYKKKGLVLPFDESFVINFPHRTTFGSDELFLSKYIYPYAKEQGLKTIMTPITFFSANPLLIKLFPFDIRSNK
jgi:hypothetical protein